MKHLMDDRFTIRDAIVKDIDHVVGMRLRLQEHLLVSNPNVWQMSKKSVSCLSAFYKGALKDARSRLVVAEDNESGRIVGMGFGRIMEHEEHVPSRSGKIDDIWVEPSYRHKGLCQRMISELLTFFGSSKIDTIILNYVVGNLEAEAVWQRLGFSSVLITSTAKRSDVESRCRQKST
jgi:ribosomal protein S18 acetylase RimI-like enzyme